MVPSSIIDNHNRFGGHGQAVTAAVGNLYPACLLILVSTASGIGFDDDNCFIIYCQCKLVVFIKDEVARQPTLASSPIVSARLACHAHCRQCRWRSLAPAAPGAPEK